jgi:hypothetical protein
MLSEEQKREVSARMMFAVRPDPADKEEVAEWKRLLAEVCYEALRVRTESEGDILSSPDVFELSGAERVGIGKGKSSLR